MKYLTLLLIICSSCDMQQEIDLDLSDYQPEYAVECYLKPGSPYTLFLSKTEDYLADPGNPVLVGASVVIKYKNREIILEDELNGFYIAGDTVPYDFNEEFQLEVVTPDGEKISSQTRIKPPVLIDSTKTIFSQTGKAAIEVFFEDTTNQAEYFVVFAIWTVNHEEVFTRDQIPGGEVPYVTPFTYEEGDVVGIELININKDYYDFISSSKNAKEANDRPIYEPVFLKSNVKGGIGIFTGFVSASYPVKIEK